MEKTRKFACLFTLKIKIIQCILLQINSFIKRLYTFSFCGNGAILKNKIAVSNSARKRVRAHVEGVCKVAKTFCVRQTVALAPRRDFRARYAHHFDEAVFR